MIRIAIIGGGIAGLSAAFTLEKRRVQGAPLEFFLYESTSRFGGVIQTVSQDGCLVETGPDSFLTEKPWAADLCRELGMGDQLVGSNDAERKTYMVLQGRLVPIPDGLMFMVPTKLAPTFFSPLFSWGTKLRILREWFYRQNSSGQDVTVAEFVERHYGREMVERVADPLLAGVYGGSADELSVNSVLPRFLRMEETSGSLGKAMLASRRAASTTASKALFTSLRDGMQQLVDKLLTQIPESSRRCEVAVRSVNSESGKWLLNAEGRTEEFDAVVVATPAYVAGELLSRMGDLAAELRSIPYSSSVTVALGYDRLVRESLPPGFGFLVPRTERKSVLAATFVHNKFPGRVPGDQALVRCFLGGSRDEQAVSAADDEIARTCREELRSLLSINVEPRFVIVRKWPRAMAQYAVGHSAKMERVKTMLSSARGVALAGNAYSGIGVPDCIRSGAEAADKVLADLGFTRAASVMGTQATG
jgi:protoporphyrinogen/coproporphyrinogen III oxidase